jgi:drug/metabolite transporter (DMT)-like permease
MQLTSVSTAVILMYTAPIYVMTFSVLFLGEKMTKLKLFAVILMLVGCCLVSGVLTGFSFDLVGILFGLLSGIGYASYNIIAKISLRRGGNPISATVYGFLTMTVVAACFGNPQELLGHIRGASFPSVCLLVGLGIGTAVIPYLAYTTALRDIPAGTASALSIIEPMAASIFSFLFLGEQPDVFSLLGIVLILFAVFSLGVAEGNHKINKRDMEKNK